METASHGPWDGITRRGGRKVAIIGAGNVGATTAYALVLSGLCSEIVVVDIDAARAEGEAMDLAQSVPFGMPVRVRAGTYRDIGGAHVTVITAGANQRPGESRTDLLLRNWGVFKDVIPQVAEANPEGIIVIATNPVDVLTFGAWGLTNLPRGKVIGSGTILDTARFRSHLASHFRVDARSVHAYIIDTGVLLNHVEFSGRMGNGFDAVTSGGNANDCNGHGTHVAGTVGGTTYGIAKKVTLVPVRVLDCGGSGSLSGVIAGIDWAIADHAANVPAVANMSLGGGFSPSLDSAVANGVADGITFAVAAGNSNRDACFYSPARATAAITVAASGSYDSSNPPKSPDAKASYSNYGSCVDIWAPGTNITSAWATSDTATNRISGTSMATPHVTGVAALILTAGYQAPSAVASAITSSATTGKITGMSSTVSRSTVNRLLFTNR